MRNRMGLESLNRIAIIVCKFVRNFLGTTVASKSWSIAQRNCLLNLIQTHNKSLSGGPSQEAYSRLVYKSPKQYVRGMWSGLEHLMFRGGPISPYDPIPNNAIEGGKSRASVGWTSSGASVGHACPKYFSLLPLLHAFL